MYVAASDKQKVSNIFKKHLKATDKNCCSVNRFTADCKASNPDSKTDGQNKMKRLKSRRKRSQMRGVGKEALKSRSHHNHSCCQANENTAHFYSCCHNSCHCPSRSAALFPNALSAAQEPSIITDSRLIGHQGLFNHEVKSVDIERMLSERRKMEKSGRQVQKKNNATSHPSSASHIPSPFSTSDFLAADEKKAGPETKARDDFQDKENRISQGADLTLGQRPQQQLDHSSGSCKSIFSSKHSPLDVMKSRKVNPAVSEKDREPQGTPAVDRENLNTLNKKVKSHMISTLEHTPRNHESPVHLSQAHGFSPSPLQVSCSNTVDSNDMEPGRQDPDCVSQFVSAVASDLCDSLPLPVLKRRSLVAESREVLLKALRESHGPNLERNLLKVQRYLSFGTDPAKHGQHQESIMTDADEHSSTAANRESHPSFDSHKTTSCRVTRSRCFNWKSRTRRHHNHKPTSEWLRSPVLTSDHLMDDILRPARSPQLCMYFENSGATAGDHLFPPFPTSWREEKASPFHQWEDKFNMPKSKEAVMFGTFGNRFVNQTRAGTERRSGFQYNDSNIQPFFPYKAQRPDRYSAADPARYPQEQDLFETDRRWFSPSAQTHHPQQRNRFQAFSRFSCPSLCPPLRSHHADITHYPPSHMLERDLATPLSALSSPEHWSFPPMRLY